MSLRGTIAAGIETAFAVAAEFVITGDYLSRSGNGVYDPETEQITPDGTTITGVRFLPTNNQLEEREASPVAVTDLKFLVPGVDLKGAVPKDTDRLFVWNKWYNVVLARAVPGQDLWLIFVRQA